MYQWQQHELKIIRKVPLSIHLVAMFRRNFLQFAQP